MRMAAGSGAVPAAAALRAMASVLNESPVPPVVVNVGLMGPAADWIAYWCTTAMRRSAAIRVKPAPAL